MPWFKPPITNIPLVWGPPTVKAGDYVAPQVSAGVCLDGCSGGRVPVPTNQHPDYSPGTYWRDDPGTGYSSASAFQPAPARRGGGNGAFYVVCGAGLLGGLGVIAWGNEVGVWRWLFGR